MTAPAVDGSQRVRLRFEPDGADVRVPSGTPIFDAASWIAAHRARQAAAATP